MNHRQRETLELLAARGEVSVQALAERFGVSEMTIRRDLSVLEGAGELQRTHGGAVLSRAGVVEFAFRSRGGLHAAEKRAIAARAAERVREGMTVSLDTGTTTMEVARAIGGMKNLKVLTCSLPVASILYANPNVQLVLLGGTVRPGSPDLSGWLTEENLKQFRVDLAVLGADAADRTGLYTTDTNVARVSQAMVAGAGEAMLVADHTKFDRTAFVRFATWDLIDYVVTDSGVGKATRKWLMKAAGKVVFSACSS